MTEDITDEALLARLDRAYEAVDDHGLCVQANTIHLAAEAIRRGSYRYAGPDARDAVIKAIREDTKQPTSVSEIEKAADRLLARLYMDGYLICRAEGVDG